MGRGWTGTWRATGRQRDEIKAELGWEQETLDQIKEKTGGVSFVENKDGLFLAWPKGGEPYQEHPRPLGGQAQGEVRAGRQDRKKGGARSRPEKNGGGVC